MPFDEKESRSYKLRQQLNHPVLDSDGHTQEYHPILLEYLKEEGGSEFVDLYRQLKFGRKSWHKLTPEERFDQQERRPPFWTMPAKNTRDLATAMFPNLFRARMDEMGLDFAVVYSSQFFFATNRNAEIRQIGCRALNRMNADMFRDHRSRMAVAAVIPTWTPEEAIAELDHAVGELGLKVVQLTNLNFRPIPIVEREAPHVSEYIDWIDPLALDSPYDYDPVWRKCIELKVAPTAHVGGQGWGPRASISSYVYNHCGAFAMGNDAFCKALFLGGVTRRFPELNFAFLEGGVHWGVALFNDLVEHWKKRNIDTLRENLDPNKIDRNLLGDFAEQYGGKAFAPFVSKIREHSGERTTGARPGYNPEPEEYLDDFSKCGIKTVKDICDLFVPHFFFGCEADDRLVATAFDKKLKPMGARLNALFSSDISHWDVTDMAGTLAEAHELVEHGLIDDADFRDFTFTNLVRLHGEMNADFFKGTIVEDAANKVLARA